jgi:hypothetical protein
MLIIYYVIETDIETPYTNGNNKNECVSFLRHPNYDVFIYSFFFSLRSNIEDGCKVRLLVVMYSLLELDQEIKDTFKIEYA